LALTSFVIAYARPSGQVRERWEQATVMMAIDVSLSMNSRDVYPNRLEAAKKAAYSFVDILPGRLNLGLVSFSETAQVPVFPTKDRTLVKRSIRGLGVATNTAIGDAVLLCLE